MWNTVKAKTQSFTRRRIAVIGVAGVLACATAATAYYHITQDTQPSLTLSAFEEGTVIDFEILANNHPVADGQKIILDPYSGVVLSVPEDYEHDTSLLSYNLTITKGDADPIDVTINTDQTTQNATIAARGLEMFDSFTVANPTASDDAQNMLQADWAGIMAEQDIPVNPNSDAPIALAFRNTGVDPAFNPLNAGGKMEILFGSGSRSSTSDVQRNYSAALVDMTRELTAVMAKQTQIIGTFFDASIQLETQRKHQELRARASKDYHPSEQMCRVGTFIRSVAHTERTAEINKIALNRVLMNNYLATEYSIAEGGPSTARPILNAQYSDEYCDPRDNNNSAAVLCDSAATTPEALDRRNKDIDYTRTFDIPLTLDLDFAQIATTPTSSSSATAAPNTDDEEDIIALARNLYFDKTFEFPDRDRNNPDETTVPHFNSRSFAAKMNVAHTSFINIVGMKSSAPQGQQTTATDTSPAPPSTQISPRNPAPQVLDEDTGWSYMKALMREFRDGGASGTTGISDDDIHAYLGDRPSYYAQMEVLTKKMFQHPNFYTNLYDKPANIARIGASLDAIGLMHDRDRYESLLRREMLSAVLLEETLRPELEENRAITQQEMRKQQIRTGY